METRLRGKVTMVSGASKGIGRAVAETLTREGASLSLCARGAEQLVRVARAIEDKHGVACLPVTADLSRAEDIQSWARATIEQFGGVDVLINNAGSAQGGPRVVNVIGIAGVQPMENDMIGGAANAAL